MNRPPAIPKCPECGGRPEKGGYLVHQPECPRLLRGQLTAARQRPGFVERLRRRMQTDKVILERLKDRGGS